MNRRTRLAALLVLLVLASACGGTEPVPETDGVRLWFAVNENRHGPALESQPYPGEEPPQPEELLNALLAGPTQEGLRSPFPRGVTLRQCGWDEERPGVLLVSLSEQYGALADISLTLADYCIVLTLSQVEGVETVEITSAGHSANYRSHPSLSAQEAVLWDELTGEGPKQTEEESG